MEAEGYRLISTIAEPAMGNLENLGYKLVAGFPATIPLREERNIDLFSDSFERLNLFKSGFEQFSETHK